MAKQEPLVCFLVAPFGEKQGQVAAGLIGSFELIRASIKEIVESFPDTDIVFKRADEIVDVARVSKTFIPALLKADIVVADLSAIGNANVFYELGIRFALRKGITIPIWQKGTRLPADVNDLLGVEYEGTNPAANRERFHEFIRRRLETQPVDSPVYEELPTLEVVQAEELSSLRQALSKAEEKLRQAIIDDAVQLLWDEAERLIEREDLASALDKFKRAYDNASYNIRLSLRYGQLLSRAARHDDAIAVLSNVVRAVEAAGAAKAIPYRELGMAYSRAKKSSLAVDWLTKSVAENPSDSDAHGIIGGVHKEALEIDKAIDAYQRGFDFDDGSTYCLLNVLGLLLVRNNPGDKIRVRRLLPKADELTEKAAMSDGADHWAFYDRGHCLLYGGRVEQAAHWFAEALKATKTLGELESARKNIDLLIECDVAVDGIDKIAAMLNQRQQELTEKQKR